MKNSLKLLAYFYVKRKAVKKIWGRTSASKKKKRAILRQAFTKFCRKMKERIQENYL